MKESYGEGVAIRTGPESCVGHPRGSGEALTGVHAGREWSREILLHFRVPTLWDRRKAISGVSLTRGTSEPCAVEDLGHVWKKFRGHNTYFVTTRKYAPRINEGLLLRENGCGLSKLGI
jgi:hypothetical protein